MNKIGIIASLMFLATSCHYYDKPEILIGNISFEILANKKAVVTGYSIVDIYVADMETKEIVNIGDSLFNKYGYNSMIRFWNDESNFDPDSSMGINSKYSEYLIGVYSARDVYSLPNFSTKSNTYYTPLNRDSLCKHYVLIEQLKNKNDQSNYMDVFAESWEPECVIEIGEKLLLENGEYSSVFFWKNALRVDSINVSIEDLPSSIKDKLKFVYHYDSVLGYSRLSTWND